jgi:hypothetical protein
MDALIALVKEIETSELEERPYLTNDDHPNVSTVARMLEDIFITAGGHMNYDLKDVFMETYGYELYPVEKDRWGWILGGLQTSKGTITFG